MNTSKYILILLLSISCSSKKNRINTIKMVQDNPTEYSEKKDFRLSKFTVVETASFLNTSISIIDDTTGKIPLILSKPFTKGQVVKGAKVRYVRLFSDGKQTIECLVDRKSAEMIASYGPMVTNFILELSLKALE